ncbi:hypothetical protein E6P06_13085 [Citrobacter sp. CF971]|nr:hypothetical protein E6P06_13085 [Citrobacter sp. CF971]
MLNRSRISVSDSGFLSPATLSLPPPPNLPQKSNNLWWSKLLLIYARSETAATRRMFKPLWQHGRAIFFADGCYEWENEGNKKQHGLPERTRK